MLRASRRHAFIALLAAVAVSAGVAAADPRPVNVVIRVYDGTLADAASRAAAIQGAAAILAASDVRAAWYDCTGDSSRPGCGASRHERELIVRIMTSAGPGSLVAAKAHETRRNAAPARLTLGFAVIDSASGGGALATIFVDRVEAVAHRSGVPSRSILARAIAHEVGHLLGAHRHGPGGLMREVWTDEEIALRREEDWQFAPSERRILQTLQP